MKRATVTSKGQITIPIEVRDAMGLVPGSKVVFLNSGGGAFVMRRMGSIDALEGCLAGYPDLSNGLEEDDLIAQHVVERDEATRSGARNSEDEAA